MGQNFSLYTGIENFAKLIESGDYYVDKTAWLNPLFVTRKVKNAYFIRPGRFGKTLNLSMIKEFCELNYENPGDKSRQQRLFIDNGRNLAVAGDEYQELRDTVMGEYPVISFSFKGVEGNDFETALAGLLQVIADLYSRFSFLLKSRCQDPDDVQNFRKIKTFCKNEQENLYQKITRDRAAIICGSFVSKLGMMLSKEYHKPVLVIIDEYDVPLQKAVVADEPYYGEMLEIVRRLSVSTFKQQPDPWLYKGIVSGCLRIAHQSVFTDANNFRVYDTDDEPYRTFFGFTAEESAKLFSDCGIADGGEAARKWYDGYRFGGQEIYCPWSLMNYCQQYIDDRKTNPAPFWVNSSGNDLLTLFAKNSIEAHDAGNINSLQRLIDGEAVEITPAEFTTYPDIKNNLDFDIFMTLLRHTGYVTAAEGDAAPGKIKLRIPNLEVRTCFEQKFAALYNQSNLHWQKQCLELTDCLLAGKNEQARMIICSMLGAFISIRNSGSELYYHGFMLGVLGPAAAVRNIEVTSETESGDGYTDIVLDSPQLKRACILELKRAHGLDDCAQAAADAASQVRVRGYAGRYLARGYTQIHGMGVGFAKKICEIADCGNLAESESLK